ncbi:MAG: GAF domain-containing protein [Thermostichus sp. DRC_bins_24]
MSSVALTGLDPTLLVQLQAANEIVQELVLLASPLPGEGGEVESAVAGLEHCPLNLAQTLVQQVVNRLGAASARIWFFDPQQGCFRSVAHAGLLSPAQEQVERIYPDSSPLGRVAQQGLPLLSNNPAQEPWMPAPEWVEAHHLRSFVAYPISRGEERLGALALFSHTPLDGSFLEVVKFLCSYAASAIINAQLLERSQRQAAREALLNRITSTVHRSLHWDQIVARALQELQQTLLGLKGLSRCCFYSLNPSQQTIQVTHEAHSAGLTPSLGRVYPMQDFGPLCEPLRQGQVVQIALPLPPDQDPLPPEGLAAFQALQARSAVLIPVQSVGSAGVEFFESGSGDPHLGGSAPEPEGMIGLLGVYMTTPHPWQPEEIELLRSVAYQLAIALTRSSLFDHARQQTERLALLHSITAAIRSSLEPTTLFHAITQQIGVAFQADVCTLALWQPEQELLHPVGIYAPQLTPTQLEALLPGMALLGGSPELPWVEPGIPQALPETIKAKLRLGGSLLARLTGPVVLPDPKTLLHCLADLEPRRQGSGLLLVPLFAAGNPGSTPQGAEHRRQELLGGIALMRHPQPGSLVPPPWQADDLELAEAVAEQAAMAIGQARLLKQTQHLLVQTRQQAEQASLLNRMTDRIRHSLDLDEILQSAVEEVGRALQACRAQFVFFDPAQETGIFRYAYARPGIDSWLGRRIPIRDNPIAPYLEAQADPLEIRIWSGLESFDAESRRRFQEAGVRTVISASLQLGSGTFGVLSVHRCHADYLAVQGAEHPLAVEGAESLGQAGDRPACLEDWSPADQTLLRLVAEQLILAITHSRLYEKTQQQARRETLLNELTAQIRTSLEPRQVLYSIVRSLEAALQLDGGAQGSPDASSRGSRDRCEIILYRSQPSVRQDWIEHCHSFLRWMDTRPLADGTPFVEGLAQMRQPVVWSEGIFVRGSMQEDPLKEVPIPFHSFRDPRLVLHTPQLGQAGDGAPPLAEQERFLEARLEFCLMHPDTYELLRRGEPFLLKDARRDPLYPDLGEEVTERLRYLFQVLAIRSMALIPIRQEGELIGTIALIADPHPREFRPEELSLAMAVAEQAGIALKQAQLYEQTRISAQRESLLRQIAQRLSGTYDPQQVVQIALEGMADALQISQCDFIALQDPCAAGLPGRRTQDQAAADPLPHWPTPSEPLKVLQEYRRQPGIPSHLGQTVPPDLNWLLLLNCYGSRDTLLIQDVNQFPLPAQTRRNLLQSGIRSLLCVPMTTDADQIAGVLCAFTPPEAADAGGTLTRSEGTGFSESETDLVKALADIAAVALQRALFYERVRRQEATAAALRGLTEGREAESRRLAADLHDQTLADLGALSRQIQELSCDPTIGQSGQDRLQAMSAQLRETIAELRGIVEDLQPTAMRAFNLGPALRSLLERAAQRSAHPLVTRFDDRANGLLSRLSPACQSSIFRIVQEALNNIVKHAGAQRIDITIQPKALGTRPSGGYDSGDGSLPDPRDPYTHLELKIIDNGRGMPQGDPELGSQGEPNPETPGPRSHGHGLLNMRYRAELIGATIAWRTRRFGSGTVVELLIPLPPPP